MNPTMDRLLVMGDSIVVHPGDPVEGYPRAAWTDRLRLVMAPSAYRNVGVSGARAAQIRAQQLGPALDFRPDLVVLAAGANDAVRRSFDVVAVEAELERMVGALAGAGALVITLGCFDLGLESLRALSRATERVTRRHGGMHLDFGDHPAQRAGDVLGADRLHINARGHAVVAEEIIGRLAARRSADRPVGTPPASAPRS
jgi:lysophospholipase L1-like esterase